MRSAERADGTIRYRRDGLPTGEPPSFRGDVDSHPDPIAIRDLVGTPSKRACPPNARGCKSYASGSSSGVCGSTPGVPVRMADVG